MVVNRDAQSLAGSCHPFSVHHGVFNGDRRTKVFRASLERSSPPGRGVSRAQLERAVRTDRRLSRSGHEKQGKESES